ncbi:MAG: PDZ domain-containing protein [Flavobacterium sp.]
MKYKLIAILIFLFSSNGWTQNGFQFETNKKKISIPFKFINNLIIIPIQVNGVSLNFMVDTGVEETILFSIDETNGVNFSKIEKVRIRGFGSNDAFDAYKTDNNKLEIKNYTDTSHRIYLVLDQNINISSQVGVPVNGIIGNKLFKNKCVKIDYISKRIIIYNNEKQIKSAIKNHSSFPIELIHGKPYLIVNAFFNTEKQPLNSKLLIDTGNTDAFWFFKQKDEGIEIPKKHIDDFLGRGFSGDVFGKRGRIPSISIGNYNFKNPIAAFPDTIATSDIDKIEGRLGSIGSEVMRRFSAIYDYSNNLIYLKKNNNYKESFSFNMSGVEVQHQGLQWITETYRSNTVLNNNLNNPYGNKLENNLKYRFELKPIYVIANVRKDSPAAIAGLKKEDVIVTINNQNGYNFTLQKINELLKSEEGKSIEFEIDRKGKIMKFRFQLKNIL